MLYTVDAGYKITFGSRIICSYNRYKVCSRYDNCFPEDGSYVRNVLLTDVLNRHPLYYEFMTQLDIMINGGAI